jgi:hypothetical protein
LRVPPVHRGVDLAFLPIFALAIGPPIYRAGARHNFGFPIGTRARLRTR